MSSPNQGPTQPNNKINADIKSLYNILIFQTIENTNNNQLKLTFTEYLKKHNMDALLEPFPSQDVPQPPLEEAYGLYYLQGLENGGL